MDYVEDRRVTNGVPIDANLQMQTFNAILTHPEHGAELHAIIRALSSTMLARNFLEHPRNRAATLTAAHAFADEYMSNQPPRTTQPPPPAVDTPIDCDAAKLVWITRGTEPAIAPETYRSLLVAQASAPPGVYDQAPPSSSAVPGRCKCGHNCMGSQSGLARAVQLNALRALVEADLIDTPRN